MSPTWSTAGSWSTPRQARELLTAVTYVGRQRRGPRCGGQRLMALYACLYFAALRAGAAGLRTQDCCLPQTGWGRLTLEKSRPEANRRWTPARAIVWPVNGFTVWPAR